MADGPDPAGVERVFSDAIEAARRFETQRDGALGEVEGVGEAADGMVTVRTGPPGRITGLAIDPRMLRLGTEALAAEVMEAVNAALADLQKQSAEAADGMDFTGLTDRLQQIQQDSARNLSSFVSALAAAQNRLGDRG